MLKTISLRLNIRCLSTSTKCLSYPWIRNKDKEIWTKDNVVKPIYDDVSIPDCSLPEFVWTNLDKWPTKTATVCGITGRSFTYEQMYRYTNNFAANLKKKLRLRDGECVAIMLHNIPDYPFIIYGIMTAGAIPTTINPIYTAFEVQRQIVLSDPKAIVVAPENVNVIREALEMAQKKVPIIAVRAFGEELPEGTIAITEFSEDDSVDKSILKQVNRTTEDVALLPYSSGTTGLPKGVELTHRNIVTNCVQQDVPEVKQYRDTTETHQDAVMAILPFFHCYGMSVVMFHKMALGLKVVTLPRFQPESFLNSMKEHKINILYAAPPMIMFLGSHPSAKKEHLDNIYTITTGAAPQPAADVKNLINKIERPINFIQGYGLTETSPVAILSPIGHFNHDAVGWALANIDMKIIDAEGRALGPNEAGELLMRGPSIMKGYKDNPEANSNVFTEDGFFKSGDSAKIDEFGQITIVDRLKELIKVKGFQVPPAELESVLKEHESILDAAVIGVKDPITGEVPKAFIVLNPGYNVEEKEILEFVAKRVAHYKRIKSVTFMESIPKNQSGKIMRRELRDRYC